MEPREINARDELFRRLLFLRQAVLANRAAGVDGRGAADAVLPSLRLRLPRRSIGRDRRRDTVGAARTHARDCRVHPGQRMTTYTHQSFPVKEEIVAKTPLTFPVRGVPGGWQDEWS